ncbi:MAG: hypothetical protein IPO27_06720 [Bacteroidetes bacterium]|nr:hypothetical protein [Bacteroidota bacterium]
MAVKDDDFDDQEYESRGNPKRTAFIIILTILLACNGLLLWQFFDKKKDLEIVQQNLDETIGQKDQLGAELTRLKIEYEKISQDNTNLQAQLQQKEEVINEKISEIQRLINSGDATQLKRAKQELENLRMLNQNYVAKIDSLNTENIQLSEQNKNLNTTLTIAQEEVKTLAEQNKGLSDRIAKTNLLKAKEILITGVKFKKSGKELDVDVADETEKLRIAFTIMENATAEAGKREIFIRVISPDGAVMATSSNTFTYRGENTLYTLKETTNYQNHDTPLTYYWTRNTSYSKGKYEIEIFCTDHLIGRGSVTLK